MKFKNVPKPEYGDTKIIGRFLFFPVRLKNETRWLEMANIKCIAKRVHMEGYFYIAWDYDEFVD